MDIVIRTQNQTKGPDHSRAAMQTGTGDDISGKQGHVLWFGKALAAHTHTQRHNSLAQQVEELQQIQHVRTKVSPHH